MSKTIAFSKLQEISSKHNLSIVGFTDLTPLSHAARQLQSWQESGFAGEMNFMKRSPELLSDPAKLLPEGKSVLLFAVNYSYQAKRPLNQGHGRVARYALGRDYHKVLKKHLLSLTKELESHIGRKIIYRIFSDAVPLLERAMAERAQLGFIGKNTLLIRPGTGSMFFIAEIIWDIAIEEDLKIEVSKGSCGTCTRCQSACPTSAFAEPYKLNATRCISYLSIEKEGLLDTWERSLLGEWLLGCDICQEVCPFNHSSMKSDKDADLVDLRARSKNNDQIEIRSLFKIDDNKEFLAKYSGTAFMRPGREGLIRNACYVAANTKCFHLIPEIKNLAKADNSSVIRASAIWSLSKLVKESGSTEVNIFKKLLQTMKQDPNITVRTEAVDALNQI
ncbi:MAG: tRNA epoxyqueuosine(34) reductase QueG [bacterium]|nr:tRNA epoxyqueuosine(34) reductase QueG [bacterium]